MHPYFVVSYFNVGPSITCTTLYADRYTTITLSVSNTYFILWPGLANTRFNEYVYRMASSLASVTQEGSGGPYLE